MYPSSIFSKQEKTGNIEQLKQIENLIHIKVIYDERYPPQAIFNITLQIWKHINILIDELNPEDAENKALQLITQDIYQENKKKFNPQEVFLFNANLLLEDLITRLGKLTSLNEDQTKIIGLEDKLTSHIQNLCRIIREPSSLESPPELVQLQNKIKNKPYEIKIYNPFKKFKTSKSEINIKETIEIDRKKKIVDIINELVDFSIKIILEKKENFQETINFIASSSVDYDTKNIQEKFKSEAPSDSEIRNPEWLKTTAKKKATDDPSFPLMYLKEKINDHNRFKRLRIFLEILNKNNEKIKEIMEEMNPVGKGKKTNPSGEQKEKNYYQIHQEKEKDNLRNSLSTLLEILKAFKIPLEGPLEIETTINDNYVALNKIKIGLDKIHNTLKESTHSSKDEMEIEPEISAPKFGF